MFWARPRVPSLASPAAPARLPPPTAPTTPRTRNTHAHAQVKKEEPSSDAAAAAATGPPARPISPPPAHVKQEPNIKREPSEPPGGDVDMADGSHHAPERSLSPLTGGAARAAAPPPPPPLATASGASAGGRGAPPLGNRPVLALAAGRPILALQNRPGVRVVGGGGRGAAAAAGGGGARPGAALRRRAAAASSDDESSDSVDEAEASEEEDDAVSSVFSAEALQAQGGSSPRFLSSVQARLLSCGQRPRGARGSSRGHGGMKGRAERAVRAAPVCVCVRRRGLSA